MVHRITLVTEIQIHRSRLMPSRVWRHQCIFLSFVILSEVEAIPITTSDPFYLFSRSVSRRVPRVRARC
jgi:hypothetical protein